MKKPAAIIWGGCDALYYALRKRARISAPTTVIAIMWPIDADEKPHDKQLTLRRTPIEKGR